MPRAVGSTAVAVAEAQTPHYTLFCARAVEGEVPCIPLCSVLELTALRGSAAGTRPGLDLSSQCCSLFFKPFSPLACFPGETNVVLCRRGKGIRGRR